MSETSLQALHFGNMKYKKECLIVSIAIICGALTFIFDFNGNMWVGNAIVFAVSVFALLYLSALYFYDIIGLGSKSKIIRQVNDGDSCDVSIICCENEFGRSITITSDDGTHILICKGETVKLKIKRGSRIFKVFQFKQAQSTINLNIEEDTAMYIWSEASAEGKPFRMAYSTDDDAIRSKASHDFHKSRKQLFSFLYVLAVVVIIVINVAMRI